MQRTACRVLLSTVLFLASSSLADAAPPAIVSLFPASSPTTGGVLLTIVGSSFGASQGTLTVRTTPCSPVSWTDNQIVFASPEGTGAANEVVVENTLGESDITSFSYDPPSISGISPSSGPEAGGTVITLTGSNFGPPSADAKRSILVGAAGDGCVLVFGGNDHGEMHCTMPPGSGSGVSVVAVVDGQASNASSFDFNPPPAISSILPASGATTGGTTLTINGTAFKKGAGGGSSSVMLGGNACTVTFDSETQIQCSSPEGLGADQEVRVSTDGQASDAYLWDYDGPVIDSITPDHGPTQGNVPITIQGSNFGAASADAQRSVTVGTSPCTLVASSSDHHSIQCTLPEGQGAGRTVQVVAGGQSSSPGVTFSYDAPDLSSIAPTRASAAGGTVITITGSNFGLAASVTVDGNDCPLTMQSHTELRCTGPAASPGAALPVVVAVSGQVDVLPIEYDAPACGNGIKDVQVGEVCDDGNNNSGDGCNSDCRQEHTETDEQVGCILSMNKAGSKLLAARGKDMLTCAKKSSGGSPCVGEVTSGGYTAASDKVQAAFDKKCPSPPDFGSTGVTEVRSANTEAMDALAVDMFGADPDAALADDASAPNRASCQNDVLKAELKYMAARYKAFNKCKKEGFKAGTILADSDLFDCLATADDDPSVQKPQAAQFATMIDSCLNLAEDTALAFPGSCAGTAPADMAACLQARVRCRGCGAITRSDTPLYGDCDIDDDGVDNDSCDE